MSGSGTEVAGATPSSTVTSYLDPFLGVFNVNVVVDVPHLVFWRNVHDVASFLALDKWS